MLNYKITERPDGFVIQGFKGSFPVAVRLYPTYLELSFFDRLYLIFNCGFFDYDRLCNAIAHGLLVGVDLSIEGDCREPRRLRGWVVEQTCKDIAKRVLAHWRSLLEKVEPVIIALERKVFVMDDELKQVILRQAQESA